MGKGSADVALAPPVAGVDATGATVTVAELAGVAAAAGVGSAAVADSAALGATPLGVAAGGSAAGAGSGAIAGELAAAGVTLPCGASPFGWGVGTLWSTSAMTTPTAALAKIATPPTRISRDPRRPR